MRKPSTLAGAVAVLAAALAGCSNTETPDTTTSAPPAAVSTADPATLAAPEAAAASTVPAATTSVADPGNGIDGTYVSLRLVTGNDRWWAADTEIVEARQFRLDCRDEQCTRPDVASGALGEPDPALLEDTAGAWDTGTLTLTGTSVAACRSTSTGEYDGPAETVETLTYTLTPSGAGQAAGTLERRAVTETSSDCQAENIGYTADVYMISVDAAPGEPVAGRYLGETGGPAPAPTSVSVHLEDGMWVMRQEYTAGNGATYFVDYHLTRASDGSYTATETYAGGCVSDADGTFVSDTAYTITDMMRVRFWTVDNGRTALVAEQTKTGSSHPDADTDIVAVCAPYQQQRHFAGLDVAVGQAPVDWDAAAINEGGGTTPAGTEPANDPAAQAATEEAATNATIASTAHAAAVAAADGAELTFDLNSWFPAGTNFVAYTWDGGHAAAGEHVADTQFATDTIANWVSSGIDPSEMTFTETADGIIAAAGAHTLQLSFDTTNDIVTMVVTNG